MQFYSIPRSIIKYSNLKQPQGVFYKKGVLKIFAKLTGKHLYQSLFFNKIAGLRLATLLKRRLWHRCFPKNFAKFFRTFFLDDCFCLISLFYYHHNLQGPQKRDDICRSLHYQGTIDLLIQTGLAAPRCFTIKKDKTEA